MTVFIRNGLFSFSQNFFTQSALDRISKEIDQPVEQTRKGLSLVIPTLLLGIVKTGSRKEGAENLINMGQAQISSKKKVNNVELINGHDFLYGLYGKNLNVIITALKKSTGLNSYSIIKMMGLSGSLLLNALGSKINNERMNPSALQNYLSSQKSSLVSLLPENLSNVVSDAIFSKNSHYRETTSNETERGFSWTRLAVLVLAILLVMSLISRAVVYKNNGHQSIADSSFQEELSSTEMPH